MVYHMRYNTRRPNNVFLHGTNTTKYGNNRLVTLGPYIWANYLKVKSTKSIYNPVKKLFYL